MNPQPPLATDGGVEQSTLGNRENKLTRVALDSTSKQLNEDSNALEQFYASDIVIDVTDDA